MNAWRIVVRVLLFASSFLLFVLLANSPLWGEQKAAPDFATLSAQANAARDANRLDQAAALYKKVLALRPRWAEGWWSLGTIQYDTDQYGAAAASFQKLLALRPKDGMANAMLGLCEFELGRNSSALRHLEAAEQLGIAPDPQLRQVLLYHQSVLLQRGGRFERAQSLLQQMCLEGTVSPEIEAALGLALLRDDAKTLPQPGSPGREVVAGIGKAGCLVGQKKYEDAKALISAVTTQYPQFPNVHYASGLLLLDTGDSNAAIAQFQQEIQNNPQHVLARLKIASAQYKVDSQAGIPYAEEAVKINPQLPLGHYILGSLLLDTGNYQRAIPELEAARAGYPNEPKLYFALGSAYALAGRKQDAARARATFDRLNQEQQEKEKSANQAPERNPGD